MPNLHPNEFNWNLLNIPGDLVDMHRKSWLVFSVRIGGVMVTPSRYRFKWLQSDPLLLPHFNIAIVPEWDCVHCSVGTTLSGACLFVYLFSNMISYYWRQCTPNTWYMVWYMPSSHWTLNHVCMVLLSLIRRQRGRAWSTWTRAPSPDLSPLHPVTQAPPRCWHPSVQRDTGQWDAANNCIAHYSVSTRSHLNPGFAFTAHCSKIVSTFSAIFYKFSRNNKQSKALFNEQTTDCLRRWIDN